MHENKMCVYTFTDNERNCIYIAHFLSSRREFQFNVSGS